jgi:hypothetical protein
MDSLPALSDLERRQDSTAIETPIQMPVVGAKNRCLVM